MSETLSQLPTTSGQPALSDILPITRGYTGSATGTTYADTTAKLLSANGLVYAGDPRYGVKADGATDGIPEGFLPHEYVEPWVRMMHQEIHKIEAGRSDIDVYATTNEAEFFAVVSEYFFERPEQFQTKHPELYDMLSRIFGQKPV